MLLIVGLGNPDSKYKHTRHNFGFAAVDFFATGNNLKWSDSSKFNAKIAKSDNFLLIKPQTYYNLVGNSVSKIANFYKIPAKNILVVCDDLNLPFGTVRFRLNGSHGGNNGLKSIIDSLGTSDFPRLRLGTGTDFLQNHPDKPDFVLGKFTPQENIKIPDILLETSHKIIDFINQTAK